MTERMRFMSMRQLAAGLQRYASARGSTRQALPARRERESRSPPTQVARQPERDAAGRTARTRLPTTVSRRVREVYVSNHYDDATR